MIAATLKDLFACDLTGLCLPDITEDKTLNYCRDDALHARRLWERLVESGWTYTAPYRPHPRKGIRMVVAATILASKGHLKE